LRYFIELSYDGSAYHGWQYQPNASSVQEVLETTLCTLLKEQINIVGAGRTDTGVNASQMFAHFDAKGGFSNKDLIFKLNSFLPKDIAVHDIRGVNDEAHARFDALSRTYTYRISFKKNVFTYNHAYYLKQALDVEKMNDAAKILLEYRNFKCFSRSNTNVNTYNCIIKRAEWKVEGTELVFTIRANRFLRNMVRAIVGTLIDIGADKMGIDDLHEIIKSGDRTKAGASVPGYALYLTAIEYPDHIFKA
jgi:tRNA pseudouridine38-40 synthase